MIVTNIPNLSTKVQRYTAFTLAEVLITLGIIGVVAAMTIPVLMMKIENARYYNSFKKGYAIISQITESLLLEEGDMESAISTYGTLSKAYQAKVRVAKYCPAGTMVGECMPANSLTTMIDGAAFNANFHFYDRMVFADGSAVAIQQISADCSYVDGASKLCGGISIDINGLEKPNRRGRDIFLLQVTKNKLIPRGSQETNHWWAPGSTWYCNPSISDPNSGTACAYRLLHQGKMDY